MCEIIKDAYENFYSVHTLVLITLIEEMYYHRYLI